MPKLNTLSRYWHTLRHLKHVQFYGRLWFRMAKPRPDFSPAPRLRACSGDWQGTAARSPSMTGPESFIFLHVPGSLDEEGWDDPTLPKLWRYNQHYFDDLNAHRAYERRMWHKSFIERWINDNPPGQGSGWEPYPISLRVVNWIKYTLAGESLSNEAIHSMAIQARWLTKRLEWHLLGNHLFVNAKALMFAGLFFDGPEAMNWRKIAVRILTGQISEQILPDGGQFELSPMYHALALEDLLDLVNLWSVYGNALTTQEKALLKTCRWVIPRMQHWLAVMSHPDRKISFFNDAAFGVAPEIPELEALAQRLGFSPTPALSKPAATHLEKSGYARLENESAVLIADIAAVGPDYLPGHAHADTLSFELSIFGHRVIVNSGTSQYDPGIERHRQRGTAAHNTVIVSGQNSSEVWAGFRVAQRARVHSIRCTNMKLEARHDGYRRLNPPTDHHRSWHLKQDELIVIDKINPKQAGEARFHLHPSVQVEKITHNSGKLRLATGETLGFESTSQRMSLIDGTWHPYFGKSIQNKCLVFHLGCGHHTFRLQWDQKPSSD